MKLRRISEYVLFFWIYAVIGWIYEVVLETFIYRWGFSNRGVLFGPYCPVYGFGALAFILLVYPLIRNKQYRDRLKWIPVVFLLCMLIATAIELGTSYALEAITGSWPWQTYADYKLNFQARIALSPSVRFGLGGVFFLYVLQPVFEKLAALLGDRRRMAAAVIAAVFAADIIYTLFFR